MSASISVNVESLSGPPAMLTIVDPVLFIAAFTGRDASQTNRHIEELERLGVPRPPRVPTAYQLPNWLLRVASAGTIQLATSTSSGEAEPVLIASADGKRYVTVGSDHTDREVERTSIELAKALCPKIVAQNAWPLEEVEDHWDELILTSTVGSGGRVYQADVLSALLPIEAVLRETQSFATDGRPGVLFMGTIPLKSSSVDFGHRFTASLEDPALGRSLICEYSLDVVTSSEQRERELENPTKSPA